MTTPVFIIIYVVLMIPTYVWNYIIAVDAIASEAGQINFTWNIIQIINYLLLTVVAFLRGRRVGKGYIAAFPFVGGIFDVILIFIPFVPTVMNIVTIVLGAQGGKASTRSSSEQVNM